MASSWSQCQTVVSLTGAAMPPAERVSRPRPRMLQRDTGAVAVFGRFAGEGADLDNNLKGEGPRATGAGKFLDTGQGGAPRSACAKG